MYSSVVLAYLFLGAAFVRANPTPTTPAPGDLYNEGAECRVAWDADQTGVWTVMNVELMTGDNEQMQFLELVATVDGTNASNNSITYTCPDVDLNSQVYFYQFTSPFSTNVYWTGRFAIAAANGSTVPAPDTELSNGATISWGSGSIVGQTPGTAPAYGQSASGSSASSSTAASVTSSSGSVSAGASSSSAVPESTTVSGPPLTAAAASSSSTSKIIKTTSTPTSGGSSDSSAPASTSAAASGAGALRADGLVLHAGAALILAALTFTAAL
ncbi:hypothetical protein DAEQUDRAFT_765607 [Daedalea quercina L-15889]|uniref:Ser-Thr-rich glycosyl-phosphatidyl-inositol-anchored membrane family-domain-containing protein n=1 Tax=Daedalea quercina L-15889 TaxID=1314783 RepID=A0A165QD80_9APHY|nr:hypothetical protein DAEQUDRAFT_765607 [Daedalea quercina L-15889]